MQSHAELLPVHPPIAVFGRHVHERIMTLIVLDEMMVSGDNYLVRDEEGNTILRASAEEWSQRHKKVVYDDALQPLGEIKEKALSMHNTIELVANSGNVIIKAERHAGVDGKPMFRVQLGDKLELGVVGDWKLHAVDIVTSQGTLIARGSHDLTAQQPKNPQYQVEVAPGVDLALVAAVCMCLDMLRKKST